MSAADLLDIECDDRPGLGVREAGGVGGAVPEVSDSLSFFREPTLAFSLSFWGGGGLARR